MQRFGVILVFTVILSGCAGPRVPAPVETRTVPKSTPSLQTLSNQRQPKSTSAASATSSSSADSVNSSSSKVSPAQEKSAAAAQSGTSGTASAQSSKVSPGQDSVTVEPISAARSNVMFAWPTQGKILTNFSDPGYKGIALAGNEGDPVSAASDGRVVYSGSGLRGYGNLVIVKHDGDFLTAYAHNKSILVKEGQTVKRGQKIAELGMTDSDVPKLHFEVRQSGKPVDPIAFLPPR